MAVYCEMGQLVGQNCGDDGCGWGNGVYECGGSGEDPGGAIPLDCHAHNYPTGCGQKECGDNGAGYSCGECPPHDICDAGLCKPSCEPDCLGRECGDNGCGSKCGECPEGKECEDGKCISSVEPGCEDKECGFGDRGGSCGQCEEGLECVEGMCQELTTPDDVVTQPETESGMDLSEAEDVAVVGEAEPEPKKKSSGCAASSEPQLPGGAAILLLALWTGLVFLRRRERVRVR